MWTELVTEYNAKKLTMLDHDRDTAAGEAFARRHGIVGQPGMVIYDAEGKLLLQRYGPSTQPDLEKFIRKWAEDYP